jgi:xanthine/uracil permease
LNFIQSNSQKDNLSKAFWDIGKVILTVLVLYPLAKDSIQVIDILVGILIGILFMLVGFYIDGKGVNNE